MRAAEEVLAGADLIDGVHRLTVLRDVDTFKHGVEHAGLVDIHHELLVTHRQTALEPPGGVQHEVHTGEHRG